MSTAPSAFQPNSNHLYYPSQQRLKFFQQQQAQHRMLKEHQEQLEQEQEQETVQPAQPTQPRQPSLAPLQMPPLHARRHVQFAKQLHKEAVATSLGSLDRDSFDSDSSAPHTPRQSCLSANSVYGSSAAPISFPIPPTNNTLNRTPSATMIRRGRLPSMARSCGESTDSSNSSSNASTDLSAAKSNYRIMLLGSRKSGKTSIVRQFLYDKFSPGYKETCDDMYRGEFDIHGQNVSFDIQDVSGGYVYEFPGMRDVSLASADAFVLVFALDDPDSWEEVNRLRDMLHEVKDPEVPIVVVGNKSDLEKDQDIPHDSLEATVIFDWENGYVEASAKERRNINKIFKELLQQAKSKFDFTLGQLSTASALVNAPSAGGAGQHGAAAAHQASPSRLLLEGNLNRRQSLPAVPAGMSLPPGAVCGSPRENPLAAIMHKMHGSRGSREGSPAGSGSSTPRTPKGVKRRSSLAVLRRDSCRIS